MRSTSFSCSIVGLALLMVACTPEGGTPTDEGNAGGQSGSLGSGGVTSNGGTSASGGITGSGGSGPMASGGRLGTGGVEGTGGGAPRGGRTAAGSGGQSGGTQTGGRTAAGGRTGRGTGGQTTSGTGGRIGRGSGGSTGAGGTTPTGGSATSSLDCSAPMPAMPTSGGTTHCGSNRTGKAGSLAWELWSNSLNGNACITYYSVPAFSAKWNNNGDYLARLGIEWGGKTIAQLGEITAEFTYKKSGNGGGYSYIGVYGWARSPCVEYYIIDDSFNGMPFNPWNMGGKGSATIDGEVYKFFAGQSNGTGGSRCGTPFQQYWSIRQKGRQCGVMTISKHFEEWKKVGMNMDSILEAKILVETGGGSGTVEFPVANVTAK